MPLTEAKRKANDKYIRENMATIGCKLKKAEASAFKDYAARQGKTVNNVLVDFVRECITGKGLANE